MDPDGRIAMEISRQNFCAENNNKALVPSLVCSMFAVVLSLVPRQQ